MPQTNLSNVYSEYWVQAVEEHGGFGTWAADVVVGSMAGMQEVVEKHS